MIQNLNLVHVSLEDMTSIMREVVATELQKVKNLYTEAPKDAKDVLVPTLTRKQVCIILGVCEATLHNWNKNKILVNFKVGRKVHYRESDVLAILNPLKDVA